MYSKQEASRLRQEFWTVFGQYMTPVLSAEGEKVNWVNYKTGIKNLVFRMEAGTKTAMIAIELNHPDAGLRELYFEQFLQMKNLLHGTLEEDWTWAGTMYDESGKAVSRIFKECNGVNILKKEDWPKLISFFKPRIVALDAFWSDARYVFESLV
jgi:hypothetical protein